MKKLESKLFKKFEKNELSNLVECVGGKPQNTHATGTKSDTWDPATCDTSPSCDWVNLSFQYVETEASVALTSKTFKLS
jgi:hypothetical protein